MKTQSDLSRLPLHINGSEPVYEVFNVLLRQLSEDFSASLVSFRFHVLPKVDARELTAQRRCCAEESPSGLEIVVSGSFAMVTKEITERIVDGRMVGQRKFLHK